jgi:hypothetical protein
MTSVCRLHFLLIDFFSRNAHQHFNQKYYDLFFPSSSWGPQKTLEIRVLCCAAYGPFPNKETKTSRSKIFFPSFPIEKQRHPILVLHPKLLVGNRVSQHGSTRTTRQLRRFDSVQRLDQHLSILTKGLSR